LVSEGEFKERDYYFWHNHQHAAAFDIVVNRLLRQHRRWASKAAKRFSASVSTVPGVFVDHGSATSGTDHSATTATGAGPANTDTKYTNTASARAATSTAFTCTEAAKAINIYRGTSCLYITSMVVQLKTHLAATPSLQLNSTQAVDVAAAYLGGSALIWYDTLKTAQGQTPFATWDLFSKGITSHYLPYDRFDDAFGKIRKLQQIGPALTYVNRFNELMLSLHGMDLHTQKLMFLNGLKPSVREAVEMQQPADLQAAQELAIRADNIQFQNRPRPSNYRSLQAPTSSGPTPMELGAQAGESAPAEFYAIRCYNCNEEGHMARDCKKPRRDAGGRHGRGRGRGGRNRGRGRGRYNTHHGAPN
jgi:hypothetical protein